MILRFFGNKHYFIGWDASRRNLLKPVDLVPVDLFARGRVILKLLVIRIAFNADVGLLVEILEDGSMMLLVVSLGSAGFQIFRILVEWRRLNGFNQTLSRIVRSLYLS